MTWPSQLYNNSTPSFETLMSSSGGFNNTSISRRSMTARARHAAELGRASHVGFV